MKQEVQMATKSVKKPAKKTAAKSVKKSIKPAAKTTTVKKTSTKEKQKQKDKVIKKKTIPTKAKGVMAKKKETKSIETKETKAEKTVKTPVPQEVEITSPSKNIKKIKGYSKEDLDHFREVILEKRNEIIEQLQNLREQMMDPTTGQYVNENSPYSLHMAEQGTDAMEREKIFLWAQRENKFLGYLDDALQRIENGTYGICIECIDEPQHLCPTCPLVPKERLVAVPHSQLCLPVKQKQEKK